MLVKLSTDKTVNEAVDTLQAAVQANEFGVITRKKTLEMATLRQTGDKKSASLKEFYPEVLDRDESSAWPAYSCQ